MRLNRDEKLSVTQCIRRVIFLIVALVLSGTILANQASAESVPDSVDGIKTESEGTENYGEEGTLTGDSEFLLDIHKQLVDSQVMRASQWVDGFFDDPNNEAEATTTQFRIRPELYYREEQGAKFRLKTSVKIRVPGSKGKVSFIAGTDEDGNDTGGDGDVEDDDDFRW